MAVIADTGESGCLASDPGVGASGASSRAAKRFSSGEEIAAGGKADRVGPRENVFASTRAEPGRDMFMRIGHDWLVSGVRARVIVDRERRLLWANDAATAMLRAPQPVVLRNGVLAFEGVNDIAACHEWLGRAGPEPQRFFVCGADGGSWAVVVAQAHQWEGDDVFLAEFILSHPSLTASSSGMAAQFGLTPAECDVIDALVRLEGPAEIALRLGISINTVRTHIRRLFGKLSINSQVQLVRLAAAFSGG